MNLLKLVKGIKHWLFNRKETLDERTETQRYKDSYKTLKLVSPLALVGLFSLGNLSLFSIPPQDLNSLNNFSEELLSYVPSALYFVEVLYRGLIIGYIASPFLLKNVNLQKYHMGGIFLFFLAGIVYWEANLLIPFLGKDSLFILGALAYLSPVIGLLDGIHLQWKFGADLLKRRENILS